MTRFLLLFLSLISLHLNAQTVDTTSLPFSGHPALPDSSLRIVNLNPYFTVHVDSVLSYQFESNRGGDTFFWFLRQAPVGMRINRQTGLLTFRAERNLFLSGRLRYDQRYPVQIGIQSLRDPSDKADTSFTVLFYNTEIIPSRLRPAVTGTVEVAEGDTLRFPVFCEAGSFPIESVLTQSTLPMGQFEPVQACGSYFNWVPGYDFVKENDSARVRVFTLRFVGATRYQQTDTAQVRVVVRNALNYPLAQMQYQQLVGDVRGYILRLKYTFLTLDKSIKSTRRIRTAFDLTAASAALTGTVLTTSGDAATKRTGAIMPGVGLVLTPIKEATAPGRTAELNQATLVRASIKRLEYILRDNLLIGERDPELPQKMANLKQELKQSQLQLIDVPIEVSNNLTVEELDAYFNSPKVSKKYRMSKKQ